MDMSKQEIMMARVELFCDADRRRAALDGMTAADIEESSPSIDDVLDVLMGGY
jgi:hypothetical protein